MNHRFPSPDTAPRESQKSNAAHGTMRRAGMLTALGLLLLPALAGCAAGGGTFSAADPAGFWAGLWHGLILLFTFVISLFTDGVGVYEVANTGGWYDFGFLLGVCIFFGGSAKTHKKVRPKKARSEKEQEWEEISARVEERVRKGIRRWLEESGQDDKEWAELGQKIEEKIKRELRKWAES